MAKLPWDKITEDRGASFGSMRNVFAHILEAEESWLEALASGKMEHRAGDEQERSFKDIDAMKTYMEEVEKQSRAYITKLSSAQLDKQFELRKNKFRIEDLLMHVVEEEIHHRGELLCLMWQIDCDPPYKSYISYLLKQ
jgi:uncharacterized damage-inducible protein DinB